MEKIKCTIERITFQNPENDDSVMENLRYVFDTCKKCNFGLTIILKKPTCGIYRIDLNYLDDIDILFYTKRVIDTVNEETMTENIKVLHHQYSVLNNLKYSRVPFGGTL